MSPVREIDLPRAMHPLWDFRLLQGGPISGRSRGGDMGVRRVLGERGERSFQFPGKSSDRELFSVLKSCILSI